MHRIMKIQVVCDTTPCGLLHISYTIEDVDHHQHVFDNLRPHNA